ncbi:MAG: LysM peptidoglycan-binding domain-containing protein [Actinomycetota bacterium]
MSTAIMNRTAPASFTAVIRRTPRVDGTGRVAGARTADERGASRLRITRRGYALMTVVVAVPLAIAAFGIAVNSGGAAATVDSSSVSFKQVTVQAGESLWQVAEQIAPTADPRDVVADIVQLNQLSSAVVQPGQSLAIPQKYSR